MPKIVACLLGSSIVALFARLLLTLPFWGSGISKLVDFTGATAEMAFFGLEPAAVYAVATIVTQLVGSLLVIVNRWTWLGAGALAVFTLLTIPIAHDFWNQEDPAAKIHFYFAVEHLAVVGGLLLVAILSRRAKPAG